MQQSHGLRRFFIGLVVGEAIIGGLWVVLKAFLFYYCGMAEAQGGHLIHIN